MIIGAAVAASASVFSIAAVSAVRPGRPRAGCLRLSTAISRLRRRQFGAAASVLPRRNLNDAVIAVGSVTGRGSDLHTVAVSVSTSGLGPKYYSLKFDYRLGFRLRTGPRPDDRRR